MKKTKELVELKRLELLFREEIDKNNILLTASIAYFFVVLFATLDQQVETYFGVILLLTAIMIMWGILDKRKEIVKKYDDLLKELKNGEK